MTNLLMKPDELVALVVVRIPVFIIVAMLWRVAFPKRK